MRSDRLFAGPDFHSVLEREKARLVRAYEELPDAEALDQEVQKNLKARFLLDVPVLRPQGEQWVEEGTAKVRCHAAAKSHTRLRQSADPRRGARVHGPCAVRRRFGGF
jgi:hypothetical protein